MKFFKRIFPALLAAIMCVSTVACASTNDSSTPTEETTGSTKLESDSSTVDDVAPDDTQAETKDETTAETSALPSDQLPSLNFGGEKFNIFCTKNSPDLVGDMDGSVVEAAIHERNLAVESRLGVKLVMMEEDAADSMAVLQTLILSNDDTVDIVSGMQYQAIQQAYNNLYANMAETPYLDWKQPWWADDYMNTIQWNEKRYILVGDISLSLLKSMSAFFVNKTLYEDSFGSLDSLYATVFDGKWTWDMMNKCVSDIFVDNNGNGFADDGDILGLRTYHESPTDHMAYTAGMALSTRDEVGNIVLLEDQTRNIEIAEKIYRLMYENQGCYLNMDISVFNDHVINSFTDGRTLFCAYLMVAAESFSNMKDSYAIIPYPKLNESQDNYQTLMHDIATVFAVPKTVPVEDRDRHGAVLEAMCSESYRKVTPVYYDLVLKSRYSQDPSSARAVDMIRANIRTDFIYANNYIFSGTPLGTINRTLIAGKNTGYSSLYRKYSIRIERELDKINNGETKA